MISSLVGVAIGAVLAGLLWTAESWGLMGHLTAAVRQGAPEKTLWEPMQERPHWASRTKQENLCRFVLLTPAIPAEDMLNM